MANDDAGMSARDRRRERAKATSGANAGRAFKRYRVHLVIVLVFGAIVTAMAVNGRQSEECPGHWHASQDVFVNGQRVSYAHPKYDLNGARSYGGSMSVSAHMHNTGGNDYTWHFEPPTARTCIPYGDALRVIDTGLSANTLTLDGEQSITGTFTADANHTLAAYHRVGSGDWQEISVGRLLDRQLRANERVLIVYGNETGAALDPFKDVADGHTLQSSSGIGSGSYVPAFGVAVLGLVVLGAWHALSKRA